LEEISLIKILDVVFSGNKIATQSVLELLKKTISEFAVLEQSIVLEHLELDLLVLIPHVEQLFVKAIQHVLYQTILATVPLLFLDSLDQLVVTSPVRYLANMDQHVLDLIFVIVQIVVDFLVISAVIFRVLQDVIMVELVEHLIVVLA